MATYALTLAINKSSGSTGCSETYYVDSASYADADILLVALVAARVAILASIWEVVWGRVSLEGVAGDSILEYFREAGDITADPADVAQPWTALLTRLEAGPGDRGRKFLHGCPEDFWTDSLVYDPGNPNNADVQAYLDLTGSAPYLLKTDGGFVEVTAHSALRATSHRIGRPFGLLVGRRSSPAP